MNKILSCLVAFAMTLGVVNGAALTAERDTPRKEGERASYTVASNVIIYAGALVAVNGLGHVVPASDKAGLNVFGRAVQTKDNSTASYSATESVEVERGVFRYANGGSFNNANVGDYAYALDDQTVFTGAMATNDILAGVIVDVDSSGVWIDTRTIAGQGAVSVASLSVSGNATITGTLGVTDVATFTAESVHNLGIDADYITVDAAAGIDTKTAGALKIGETTATSVEISDAGENTDIQGTLSVAQLATFTTNLAFGASANMVAATNTAATGLRVRINGTNYILNAFLN